MNLDEFIAAQGKPRQSCNLIRRDLVALVRAIQLLMYRDATNRGDPDGPLVEIWNAGKELEGADFIEEMDELMDSYDLKPKLDAALEITEE